MIRVIPLVVCLLSSGVLAREIEVSPGQSINDAIAAAGPGDTVTIGDGTYKEALAISRSGRDGAPIIIRARNTYLAILDGGWIGGGGQYIVIDGLVVRNVRNDLQNENAAVKTNSNWTLKNLTVEHCTGTGIGVFGEDVKVLNATVRFNGHNGIGGARCKNVLVDGGEVHDNNRGVDDPPWKNFNEARKNKDGKWFVNAAWEGGGGKWAMTDGVKITHLRSYNNGGPGIWFDAYNKNFAITDCEVFGNVGTVNDWEGMGISVEINNGPAWVLRNYIHDNTGACVAIQESTDTRVQGNWIVNGVVELRAMNGREPGLKDVQITGNYFKNACIVTSLGDWDMNSGATRHITIDNNTYDSPPRMVMYFAGESLVNLGMVRGRLAMEQNGTMGKFEVPVFAPSSQPAK